MVAPFSMDEEEESAEDPPRVDEHAPTVRIKVAAVASANALRVKLIIISLFFLS